MLRLPIILGIRARCYPSSCSRRRRCGREHAERPCHRSSIRRHWRDMHGHDSREGYISRAIRVTSSTIAPRCCQCSHGPRRRQPPCLYNVGLRDAVVRDGVRAGCGGCCRRGGCCLFQHRLSAAVICLLQLMMLLSLLLFLRGCRIVLSSMSSSLRVTPVARAASLTPSAFTDSNASSIDIAAVLQSCTS